MADQYILSVTAGPNYTDQKPIPINTSESTKISSEHLTANLSIRIQNYRGLPTNSPKTSPYFSTSQHSSDLYSLAFSFTPKTDFNAHDIVFGNDFDHPIRDKLPPGFQQAFNLVKWFIDPGLYGDVYADEPYLYGPLLSSINTFRVGPRDDAEQERVEEMRADEEVPLVLEGADGDGAVVREAAGMPAEGAARKKWALTQGNLRKFTFEKGREYSCDFFNPYLDFNDFAVKLPSFALFPGVTIPIISYWDGQPLRYVLKNRATDEPLFVVVFTLVPKDQAAGGNVGAGGKEKTGGNDDDLD
ncbi:hypothetical protein MBLNU230_g2652t1 [Neophaeotheca triangularis]